MVLGPGSSGPCHARRNAATRHSRPMTWGRQQVGPTAAVRLAATLPFPASCPARCRPRPSCRPPSLHPSSHCLRGSEAWDVGDARCERSQGTRWFLGRDVYKSLCHLALRGMRGWGQTWPCGSRSLGGREGPGSQGSGGGVPQPVGAPPALRFPQESVVVKEPWYPATEAQGGPSTVSSTWEGWHLLQRGFLATDEPRRRPRPDLIKLKRGSNRSP